MRDAHAEPVEVLPQQVQAVPPGRRLLGRRAVAVRLRLVDGTLLADHARREDGADAGVRRRRHPRGDRTASGHRARGRHDAGADAARVASPRPPPTCRRCASCRAAARRCRSSPTAEFERRTRSTILQFYGSNEAGCVCGTTVDDTIAKRLGTAGRIFPEMHVRLFDDDDNDVTAHGSRSLRLQRPGHHARLLRQRRRERKAVPTRRLDVSRRHRRGRRRRLPERRRPHRRLHHPRRAQHQRAGGRGRDTRPPASRHGGRRRHARSGRRRAGLRVRRHQGRRRT